MADKTLIHGDIKFYTTADKFYLEPNINPTEILVIDRITGAATVEDINSVKIPIPENVYKPVCGFLGSIKLISGYYLVLAKYRIVVGSINGFEVYQLAGHEIIPYRRSNSHLTVKQIEDNQTYERMLSNALDTPGIYFSYGYDLTLSLQRLHALGAEFQKMSLVSRADPRFLWNGYLLKDFTATPFGRFALPLIQGFVSINRMIINGEQVNWSIVSRRSVERAGTRLFIRGIDTQGHVANFVETEQIVERGGDRSSFLQTRGSIPLYWTQYPNLKYKPSVRMLNEDHIAAYTKHLRDHISRYGNTVLVSLIDHHGKEEALDRGLRAAVAGGALPNARLETFDFHTECRKMRYDRLQVLMDRVQHELNEFGYFLSRGGSVLMRQTGVFRTNCVDCLDRTNVVQSLLAKRQLVAVLNLMGVIHDDKLDHHVVQTFNHVWADHADMISIQYSGTGALKTDFTRTGKRTKYGLVMDGVNSLTRYYKNNFCDGSRQDAIDLLLGKYVIQDGEGNTLESPLRRTRHWKYITLPSVMMAAVSLFCASAVVPSKSNSQLLLYLMIWGAAFSATLTFIFKNGPEYVEWPRLDGGGVATTRARGSTPSL